jgi:hypothetical protein
VRSRRSRRHVLGLAVGCALLYKDGMAMTDCELVRRGTGLRLLTVEEGGARTVQVELENRLDTPIWAARDKRPSWQAPPGKAEVVVSYGYFDDLHGPYRGRYMLPPMVVVAPGERLTWRIEEPKLLEKILAADILTTVRVRVALRAFPPSTVRGQQPLEAYLEASCAIQSPPVRLAG